MRGREDGTGRPSTTAAERVSDELRRGGGELLRRRRRIASLSIAASGAMALVSLYQLGILRRLPDPPLPGFASEEVDAAGEAYVVLEAADAPLALASYGATVALTAMGGARRHEERPWLPVLLAAKLAADAAGAVYLTAEQVSRHRALCFWCLTASAASVAALPQALPELRAALPSLRRRLGAAPG